MATFLVLAGPLAEMPPRKPLLLRWIKLPPARRLEVREAASGLEAIEVDPDTSSLRDTSAVVPVLPSVASSEHREIRFRLDLEEGGLELRLLGGRGAPASVVDLDRSIVYGEEPRSVERGRVLRIRSAPDASYGMILLEGNHKEDEDALASAVCAEAHALDALNDRTLSAELALTPGPVDEQRAAPLWRGIDSALRVRRELRAPFLAALSEDRRQRALRVWQLVMNRILHRHGFPASPPLRDEARDFFLLVRSGIERVRGFPPLARDAFALGVAQALDALGEGPGRPRLVPLARKDNRDHFRLTLSRQGEPEYRTFDVVRTEQGEAIVTGRRVVQASALQRVRAVRCPCGGRTYENDHHCRGCGKRVSDMGNIRVEGTFMVGATAEISALCACDGPLGAEDRYCGSCGRCLEELG